MRSKPIILMSLSLACLWSAPSARAVPELRDGACTWLVGAPPGAPSADHESRFESTRVFDECQSITAVATGTYEPNGVQAYIAEDLRTSVRACIAEVAVGHEFRLEAGSGVVTARIRVEGGLHGFFISTTATYNLPLSLILSVDEIPEPPAVPRRVLTQTIRSFSLTGQRLELNETFGQVVSTQLARGMTHRVSLTLVVQSPPSQFHIDFGPPGTGRGAWYDSIEVCVEAPPDDSALTTRLDLLELADLEARLYAKECMPGVWMPAAQGGRIERARQLVADRLAQATATGDPGVNARVATMRLASADTEIAAGQYQRACRSLSEGLRALTTP